MAAALFRRVEAGTDTLRAPDEMIAATMERRGDRELYSYDRDFDRLPDIRRREPDA